MIKGHKKQVSKRLIERTAQMKTMYTELVAQEIDRKVIIRRIADKFFVGEKTVYNCLKIRKNKLASR
ncbi:MAG: hypothetical protein WCR72_18015 [Bacteroidota bacterium]